MVCKIQESISFKCSDSSSPLICTSNIEMNTISLTQNKQN